ncbi:MAG: hypothetical protein JEZ12_23500 [Desulfobacterium sp.]|nr:hypothetical protein [Desulfobacterium sp.]
MAYTSDDLTAVQGAIVELATGKRVVKISFSNGQNVEFGAAGLAGLKTLRSEIQAEISAEANTKRYFRTVTSKGL